MEVNQSPNLKEKNFPNSGSDKVMKEHVIYDLLSMVTLQNTPKPEFPKVDQDFCNDYCKNENLYMSDMRCWSCPGWFSAEERKVLHRTALEYSSRGNYRLLFPEIRGSKKRPSAVDPPLQSFLTAKSTLDSAIERYFSAISKNFYNTQDKAMWCVSRSHCNGQGDCVNGNCACDEGYEGKTCYIPKGSQLLYNPHQNKADDVRDYMNRDSTEKFNIYSVVPKRTASLLLISIVIIGSLLLWRYMHRNRFKHAKYKF